MFRSVALASLIAAVSAHQNFHQFWVNDVSPGYHVGIRMPPSNSPVTDVSSNDLACNVGGTSGAGVATVDVKAGDKITVQWDQSTHPGPITHFLFGPVASAQGATGVGQWAKIDELNWVDGKWANEIMSAKEMKHTFTIPTGVANGEYLLRSEMLALHGAQTLGGAQFYIGCAQIRITGGSSSGTCSPKISLPGAYSANDANIYIPNFYNGFQPSTYKAPGGAVATCGGSGGTQPTTTRVTTAAASTTTARPTTTTLVTSVRTTTTAAATTTARVTTTTSRAAATTTSSSGGGAVAPKWGQCGGNGWTGPTVCAAGSTCTVSNEWYSQCI